MESVRPSEPADLDVRYRRAPSPIVFPSEAEMPETKRHLELRTLLYAVLKAFADRASVGSEQFVYWSPTDPTQCVAPDAFVKLGHPDTQFKSWKVWERGAPEVAVEIVSDHDASERVAEQKVQRYHELGVEELVRFDPDAPSGQRVRVWDRIEGDLIERVVEGDTTPCRPLGLWWVVVSWEALPTALRLARDAAGTDLVLTDAEEQRRAREVAEERQRASDVRIRELEAELARVKGG